MTANRKAVLYMTGVFAAGLLAGGLAGFALRGRPHPPEQKAMVEHAVKELRRDLRLTDDQVEQIRPLIEKVAEEIGQIFDSTSERVRAAITNCNQHISVHLTPEQRTKFEERERRREAEFRNRHKGKGQ